MWLMSSTAPISTMRSPAPTSVPVVSVSSTTSRMSRQLPSFGQHPARPARQRLEDIPYLGLGGSVSARGLHKKVRAPPLLCVRHLLQADRLELLTRHAGAGEHALLLDGPGRRDHEYGVAAALRTCLEEKRDVEHRHGCSAGHRTGEKTFFLRSHEGMHDAFELLQALR